MSNDLISRNELLDRFNRNSIFRSVTNAAGKNVLEIIEEQPGYDVEELAAYICDKLCRHSHNNGLTQDELEEICEKCCITKIVKASAAKCSTG